MFGEYWRRSGFDEFALNFADLFFFTSDRIYLQSLFSSWLIPFMIYDEFSVLIASDVVLSFPSGTHEKHTWNKFP